MAKFFLLLVIAVFSVAPPAFAEVSSSPNYQVTETQFNSGSSLNSCSAAYCAKVSIGSSSAGEASGATKGVSFGSETPGIPNLSVIVQDGVSTLGELTPEHTGTKTLVVKVKSYLSDGYILQLRGSSPENGSYALKTPLTPTSSTVGTEQFGINVVANTTPSVGANPVQTPDSSFSYGIVRANYSQANKFMYSDGDTIASSTTASGQTDYTISMVVNVANNTPAGAYGGNFSAVIVPLY